MRHYDFSVGTGEVREIIASGRYVMYLAGSGGTDAAISLRVTGLGDVVMMPGQSVRFPGDSARFLVVGDRESATVAGKLVIGDGDFNDRRLFGAVNASQAGEWETVADRRARLGGSFIASARITRSSSTRAPFLSVDNTGAVDMVMRAVIAYASGVGAPSVVVIQENATIFSAPGEDGPALVLPARLGGSVADAGTAEYGQSVIGAGGVVAGDAMYEFMVSDDSARVEWRPPAGIVVPPGKRLIVRGNAAASSSVLSLSVSYDRASA